MFRLKLRNNKTAPTPCPSGITWEIEPGDTFYIIAKKLNIPLQDLLAANPTLDPKNLQIGSKICIPSK